MRLEEVLPALRAGKKIKRASMSYAALSIIADRIHVWMRVEDDQWENVGVEEHMRTEHVLANDWQVIE